MFEPPQSLRVLVVDDEVRIADTLVQILLAKGYEATAAYSAETAMKLAGKLNPHAVISDIIMGPVSGIELANHLREHYPDCRILLISGHATRSDFSQAILTRSSAIQFMPKPVHPDRVLQFVASCREAQQAAQTQEHTQEQSSPS